MWTSVRRTVARLLQRVKAEAARIQLEPIDPIVADWLRGEAMRRRELRMDRELAKRQEAWASAVRHQERVCPLVRRPGGAVL